MVNENIQHYTEIRDKFVLREEFEEDEDEEDSDEDLEE